MNYLVSEVKGKLTQARFRIIKQQAEGKKWKNAEAIKTSPCTGNSGGSKKPVILAISEENRRHAMGAGHHNITETDGKLKHHHSRQLLSDWIARDKYKASSGVLENVCLHNRCCCYGKC